MVFRQLVDSRLCTSTAKLLTCLTLDMCFAAFPDQARKSCWKLKSSQLGLRRLELRINLLGFPSISGQATSTLWKMGKGLASAVSMSGDTSGHPWCRRDNSWEHREALGSAGAMPRIGIYGVSQVHRAV